MGSTTTKCRDGWVNLVEWASNNFWEKEEVVAKEVVVKNTKENDMKLIQSSRIELALVPPIMFCVPEILNGFLNLLLVKKPA